MYTIYLPLVCRYDDDNDIIVKLFIYTHIVYTYHL